MSDHRCLLVSGDPAWGARWLGALRTDGWRVERARPEELARKADGRTGTLVVDGRREANKPDALVARVRTQAPGWSLVLVVAGEPGTVDRGTGSGADDVVVSSISGRAFAARIADGSARRRPLGLADGAIRVDPGRRMAWTGRARLRALRLTRTEFDILALLLERRGRAVSRRELIERVWGGAEVNGETVDRHVGALRAKLGAYAGRIRTEHRFGYAAE